MAWDGDKIVGKITPKRGCYIKEMDTNNITSQCADMLLGFYLTQQRNILFFFIKMLWFKNKSSLISN